MNLNAALLDAAAPQLSPELLAALAAALPNLLAAAPPAPAPVSFTGSETAEPESSALEAPQDIKAGLASAPDLAPAQGRVLTVATAKARPGELRGAVAALLAAEPGRSFTVTEAAKRLGRSGGAVGNALTALTARGEASQTSETPRRYIATANTSAAASGAAGPGTPPPPVTPKPRRTSRAKAPAEALAPPSPNSVPEEVTPEVPAWDGRSPLPRPNGTQYHPRTLADTSDVAALRRLREANIASLLYGPPGTGKTSMIEAAFPDALTVCGDGDTTVGDLIGEYTQNPDGTYAFVYGPLVAAMQEGRVLFLDDATLIPPKVLAALYPAMDGRRQITVKAHKGETITAAPGFYVVAGHNPGVHGAVLTEALSSRFSVQVEVSSDYDLARALKIDARAVRIARNLHTQKVRGEVGWAPQLRELLAFQKITAVLGIEAAFGNLVGIAPEEDRDAVAKAVHAVTGTPARPLTVGRQIA